MNFHLMTVKPNVGIVVKRIKLTMRGNH
ncbi:uncharacterized protein METZ01_LOCUS84585 [marine metagenome]|uniref:Uncharacterized protein n=1 Tax=marine metagenome TaxID=408172 RepID=A0A381UVF4_9ZZZZ